VSRAPSISPKPEPLDWVRDAGAAKDLLSEINAQLKTKRRKQSRRLKTASATLGLLAILAYAIPTLRSTDTLVTASAHRSSLTLADGSTTDLNARTTLKTDFRYNRRRVELTSGEAFFSVAKDPNHPFIVTTPAGRITVTGTQFNVRLDDQGQPEVTLLEGAITFAPPDSGVPLASIALQPSEQFHRVNVRALATRDLDRVTAWRSGLIILEGLTLGEAAARLSTYHGTRIVVSPAIASLRMGGVYPLDDLPNFFSSLEDALAVSATRQPDNSWRIDPK
jgi:transmembrane sensor